MKLLVRRPNPGGGEPFAPRIVDTETCRPPGHDDETLGIGGVRYGLVRGKTPSKYVRELPDDYLEELRHVDARIAELRAERRTLLDEAWRRAKPVMLRENR